jgi:HD-like signal output (HDOD) protein
METKNQIEVQVVEFVERLPPMPEDIDRLMDSSREDDGQEERLIELVSKDPGLCTDLLHLANTYYGTPENKIETIAEAVRKIGTLPLIQLVGVWHSGSIIRRKFSSLKHLDEYFIHSQDISLGCLVLSEICGEKKHGCEVLAAAGLIHDIGRLVILLASKQTTASLMGTSWNKMKSIVHEERDAFQHNSYRTL